MKISVRKEHTSLTQAGEGMRAEIAWEGDEIQLQSKVCYTKEVREVASFTIDASSDQAPRRALSYPCAIVNESARHS